MSNFQDLEVWNLAMDLAVEVYQATKKMPLSEQYGASSQLRRASASIAANIAEGCGRKYAKEFAQFLSNASGSLCEVQTYLILAHRTGLLTDVAEMLEKCNRIGKMLARLREAILAKANQQRATTD
jgi:four helix bundle protein